MWDWIQTNSELLIAVFGAGGGGAILIAAFFKRSKKSSDASGHKATAEKGAIAVVNEGGKVSINAPETVGAETFQKLAGELGLSLLDSTSLIEVFEHAGIPTDRFDEVVAVLKNSPSHASEFLDVIRSDDKDKGAKLLKAILE